MGNDEGDEWEGIQKQLPKYSKQIKKNEKNSLLFSHRQSEDCIGTLGICSLGCPCYNIEYSFPTFSLLFFTGGFFLPLLLLLLLFFPLTSAYLFLIRASLLLPIYLAQVPEIQNWITSPYLPKRARKICWPLPLG